MAGKKGRCARCGKVNHVPVVLSVDVRRADGVGAVAAIAESGGASPFRSTADLVARSATVEGSVDLANGPRFRTTPLERDDLGERTIDFFDHVASRINDLADPADDADADEMFAPRPRPAISSRPMDHDEQAYGIDEALPLAEFDLAPPRGISLGRVIATALTVGLICGFCLGLFAAHWVM
jgi:hypothetical protein